MSTAPIFIYIPNFLTPANSHRQVFWLEY